MNIVEVDPLKLIPAPYNPRTASQNEFENLQRSIDSFGFVEPVIVNERTNYIVGGHLRVEAAKALKLQTVPVVYVDLDDRRERSLNVALNKIGGEFDTDQLAELLSDLDDESLLLTGFDDDEIAKLQDGWVDHEELAGETEDTKPKVKKYSIEELREAFKRYPYSEHKAIIMAAVSWLSENN